MARQGQGWLRIAAWAVAILLVLIVLVLVFFPTGAIQDRLLVALESELERPVSVADASVRLLPAPRVVLAGVHLGPVADAPPQEISVERVELHVRLLPLLRRELQITRIVITRPVVTMVLAAEPGATRMGGPKTLPPKSLPAPAKDSPVGDEGSGSGVGPAASGAQETGAPGTAGREGAPGPAAPQLPIDIAIDALALRDGAVRIDYPDGRPFLELGAIAEDLTATATAGGRYTLRGETRIDTLRLHLASGTLGEGLAVRLQKTLRYDQPEDRLYLGEATLHLGALPVAVQGEIWNLAAGAPEADVTLQGGPTDVDEILAFLPASFLPAAEEVRSQGRMTLNAELRGPLMPEATPQQIAAGDFPMPDFRLRLELAGGRIDHPAVPEPIAPLEMLVRASPDTVEITRLAARSGDSRLELRATVFDYRTSSSLLVAVDADLDLARASALQPPREDQPRLAGRAKVRMVVSGPVTAPERMEAVGNITLSDVRAEGGGLPVAVDNAGGRIRLERDELHLIDMAAHAGESDLALSGVIGKYRAFADSSAGAEPARLDLTLRARRVDLDPWVAAETTAPAGAGDGARQATHTARRGGKREVDGAAVPSAASLAALAARAEGRVRFSADEIHHQGTVARRASGTLRLADGVIHFEDVGLEVFGGEAGLAGEIDLRAAGGPRFDLEFEAREARAGELLAYSTQLEQLAGVADYLSGHVGLRAKMQGSLNDTLGLDLDGFHSTGDLALREGRLSGQPLQMQLADYLQAPDLGQLRVEDWLQPFRVEGGRLVLDGMSLRAGDLAIEGRGWQALDGSLALDLDLLVPPRYARALRDELPPEASALLLGGEAERVLLPVRVTGTQTSPRFQLDAARLTAAAQQRLRERVQEEGDRLRDDLGRRAGELLDELVGGERDSTTVDSAGSPEQPGVEQRVRGLLDNLLKR